jgi:hypothetical protein
LIPPTPLNKGFSSPEFKGAFLPPNLRLALHAWLGLDRSALIKQGISSRAESAVIPARAGFVLSIEVGEEKLDRTYKDFMFLHLNPCV